MKTDDLLARINELLISLDPGPAPAASASVPANVPARRRRTFADHMAAEKADPIAPLQVLGAGVRQAIDHEDYTRAFQLAESMLPYRHARLNAIAIGQGELFADTGEPIERDDKGRPIVTHVYTWATDPVAIATLSVDTIDMHTTPQVVGPAPARTVEDIARDLQAPEVELREVNAKGTDDES